MITKISSCDVKSSLTNIIREVFPNLDPVYRDMMKKTNVVTKATSVPNSFYKSVSTTELQKEYKLQQQAVDKFVKSEMP